jgi:hypothetical protein
MGTYTTPATKAHKDPGTVGYFNGIKADLDALRDAMSGGTDANVPATAHTHTGTGQAAVTNIGAGAVGHAAMAADAIEQDNVAGAAIGSLEVKFNAVEISANNAGATASCPSAITFFPLLKGEGAGTNEHHANLVQLHDRSDTATFYNMADAYAMQIAIKGSAMDHYVYCYWGYVQGSPPHDLGRIPDFGHFAFLRRRISSGLIMSSWISPDPPWSGDHSALPKGHPARLLDRPHPFINLLDGSDPLPSDEELVLVDLRTLAEPDDDHAPEAAAEALLVAQRADWLKAGIAPEDLDRFEAEQTMRADVEALAFAGTLPLQPKSAIGRRRTRLQAIEDRAKLTRSSLLAEINEGRVPCCSGACYELGKDERDMLPTVLVGPDKRPWREVVRVVRSA